MKCLKIKTQHKIKKLKSLEEKNRNLIILYQNNMWIEKVNYMCFSIFVYSVCAICSATLLILQLPNAVTSNILVVSSEIFALFLINYSVSIFYVQIFKQYLIF